jgi:cation diffusion facilitator CzcD-associated flavoprotein CzcO
MTVVDHEVVIVGAGFAGLGTAIRLQKAGVEDYLIVEEGDGPGGTWNWNRYPGVAVDIPSFGYQFSFEPRATWSRVYAPGAELRDYAEHCVDTYGLHEHLRYGCRIVAADFDADAHAWTLTTAEDDTITARFVIAATGVLSQPKLPDIPGVADFAGTTLHTARWDDTADLTGKRVAIIGTGASAVQVIPTIAEQVEHLTVFQRTPIWCLPRLDAPLPPAAQFLLGRVPFGQTAARLASQALVEVTLLAAHFHGIVPVSKLLERTARTQLRARVRDPETRAKLTPQYGLGCKRPSFSNTYLQTFNRDDVHLETNRIEHVSAGSVHTADGVAHQIDVLILATGFKTFEPGSMPPFDVRRLDGIDLATWWDEHRHQSYEGVSVPGVPNFFFVHGPYAYNGASYFDFIETQARHIARCLRHTRRRGATLVEVRREANDRYFAEMLRRRRHQIFWQDSCATANSYYFDQHGDVPLRAASTLETTWRSARFDLDDYRYETLLARDAHAETVGATAS